MEWQLRSSERGSQCCRAIEALLECSHHSIFQRRAGSSHGAALEYLSRHGVHAELDTSVLEQDPVEESLVQYATQKKASYIVMGGYGHNRAGEFLFGGVNSFPAESLSGRFGARSLGPVNISVFY